jgi:hypothetical protein
MWWVIKDPLTPHNALLCSRSQPDRSAGTGVQNGGYACAAIGGSATLRDEVLE